MKKVKLMRVEFLHPFMIPLYFIFHNYIDFTGLVTLSKLIFPIFTWLSAPFIFILLYLAVFRNFSHSAFLTSILLMIFFFTGPVMTTMKNLPLLSGISRYSIILPVLIIAVIFAHIFVYRKKPVLKKAHRFLFFLFLLLFLHSLAVLIITGKQNLAQNNKISIMHRQELNDKAVSNSENPDIYFLLFDELASCNAISDLFGYRNNAFTDTLSQLGFMIQREAFSKYYYTPYSMFSVLDFSVPSENFTFTYRETYALNELIKKNQLTDFLGRNGYAIINAGIFEIEGTDNETRRLLQLAPAEDMILRQTFFNRIIEDLSWNYTGFYKQKFINKLNNKIKNEVAYTNRVINLIDSTVSLPPSRKKFIYAHFMLPHDPYKFDSSGAMLQWDYQKYLGHYTGDSTYLSQLVYTRNLIVSLASKIKANSKRPAVIIIQGDHGYRMLKKKKFPVSYKNKVFSAIYLPDRDYRQFSDSLYTPNTFRVILNTYFNTGIPILQNKSDYIETAKDKVTGIREIRVE